MISFIIGGWILLITTVIWIGMDYSQIARQYGRVGNQSMFSWTFGSLGVWIVGFPWYIAARDILLFENMADRSLKSLYKYIGIGFLLVLFAPIFTGFGSGWEEAEKSAEESLQTSEFSGEPIPNYQSTMPRSSTSPNLCTFCDGKGYSICTFCNGNGSESCAGCGGVGTVGAGDYQQYCPICGGKGQSICTICSGTGKTDCPLCVNGYQ